MNNKCVIICAGPLDKLPGGFKINKGDLVICADGGLDHAVRLNLPIDIVIGDMDSLSNKPIAKGVKIISYPEQKDETDALLALDYGARLGFRDFVILGAIGGRIDHTLGAISLLARAHLIGHTARLIDDTTEICFIKDGEIIVEKKDRSIFSVLPVSLKAHGVTITGAKYNIKDYDINFDFPIGVSNQFLDDTVKIAVKKGALIIIAIK